MCRGLMSCVLIVVNIVVMVLSLAFTVVGGILLWSKPLLHKIVDHIMQAISESLGQQDQETVNYMMEELMKLSRPIGGALFGVGVVLFVFNILAFVGVCCNQSIFLIIYAVLLGILIVAHVLFLIIYFANKNTILGYVHRFLENQVMKYKSLESKEPDSILLGALMVTLRCCGYNDGSDFNKPDAQFTHRDFVDNHEFAYIQYPVPCCKDPGSQNPNPYFGKLNQVSGSLSGNTANDKCPYTFTEQNSFINYGCSTVVDKDLVKLFDFVAYVSIGPLLLQVLLFAMAVAIVIMRKRE